MKPGHGRDVIRGRRPLRLTRESILYAYSRTKWTLASGPALAALRGHARELAAGHVQHLPVHVVRPRRAQEEDAAGCLLRCGRAAERDQHRRHRAHLLRDAELDVLALALDRLRPLLGRRQ